MREALIGFDARAEARKLSEPYRATFLLRDVERVLSADGMLWPSKLTQRPKWIGANPPFWENMEKLERHLAGQSVAYWLIAATWHIDGSPAGTFGPYETPTTPPSRDPAWSFLGYDVTDGSFLSGLSNCGYTEEDRRQLAPEWPPRLNSSHLFDNLDHAFEFRTLTDKRVPEHAPFFVIGLWSIRA
jgi:hypothetical protein